MDSPSLQRNDTTRGRPLRILSLDGGGVRGYSMLIILRELMHLTYEKTHPESDEALDEDLPGQTAEDSNPRPCEYFDLIGGTGTGGLIAIMLGRLRMSVVDCMKMYVRMTKKVFETDKTIVGIPYRSTLFKASKLEDAIRECVQLYENESFQPSTGEGHDTPMSPTRPGSMYSVVNGIPRRTMSYSSTTHRPSITISPPHYGGPGNPDAYLYDSRPNRTKTAVTAVYKGAKKGDPPALLRSYRSRKKPPPEFKCTIWQAGRATCATKLAFKPVQLGQSIFLDEGDGMINLDKSPTYNPAPYILDEAIKNEWPGQQVGVFVSVGTGKRPSGTNHMQSEWWEGFAGGLGDFAEAKRKLIMKIEGCETTHRDMSIHLRNRGLKEDCYFRLNVEVGVGEFGINEWNRLTDIRASTELYLNRPDVRDEIERAARLMATTGDSKLMGRPQDPAPSQISHRETYQPAFVPPLPDPHAVELPGEGAPNIRPRPLSSHGPRYPANPLYTYQQPLSPQDKFSVLPPDETLLHRAPQPSPVPSDNSEPPNISQPALHLHTSNGFSLPSPRRSAEVQMAPPLPPKTPIPFSDTEDTRRHTVPRSRGNGHASLPYPDDDEPPPAVNMARKPQSTRR